MQNTPRIILSLALLFGLQFSSFAQKVGNDEFEKKIKELPQAQLIDVRTPEEFAEGHLVGAKNLNIFDDDFITKIEKLDKKKPVLVYCHSGGRSGEAYDALKKAGFATVLDMKGGFSSWKKEGRKIEVVTPEKK